MFCTRIDNGTSEYKMAAIPLSQSTRSHDDDDGYYFTRLNIKYLLYEMVTLSRSLVEHFETNYCKVIFMPVIMVMTAKPQGS